jgi:hypothetical protein
MLTSVDGTIPSKWVIRCYWQLERISWHLGSRQNYQLSILGPFEIVAAVGTRAFKLNLPETVNIHPVFHVFHLNPYVSSSAPVPVTTPPPLYTDKRGGVYAVETILAKKGVGKEWKYLVNWTGYDDSENTWEPFSHVRHLTDLVAAAPVFSKSHLRAVPT